jgi:hypothetical protein
MKSIPLNQETSLVAAQIIWFEAPAKALSDPVRFMAYAMTYAMHEEMRVIRRYVSDDDFREALDRAPPGIIDARSWAYWNSKMGRYPPPPLPLRQFGSVTGPEKLEFARSYQGDNCDPTRKLSSEETRRNARAAWLKMRQEGPSAPSLEEKRRRTREEWLARYGPGTKS